MSWNIVILAAQVVIGIVSILVGYYTIHRHRVIYHVEHKQLELGSFEPQIQSDEHAMMQELNKRLEFGKYTILSVSTDHEHHKTDIYLGRVRN